MRDEALVAELGGLIQTDYLKDEEKQFAALDFVFEALDAGSTEAQKQLQRIVSDDFIENPKNALSERQAVAELKAEILYRWLASAPELEAQMRDSLPGSVSKKLWDNVKRAHKSNEQESDRSS